MLLFIVEDQSKVSIIKSLQELEDTNILIKVENTQDRRRHDYFINPISAWKGNSFTRQVRINKMKETKEGQEQLNLFNLPPEHKKKAIKPSEDF